MLTLKAYAKINLSLGITGVRQNGYHDINTVMQSISLFDKICIDTDFNGISVCCKDNDELCGEDNIAYKAAEYFYVNLKLPPRANIVIEKNIPLAAGLGGGSADAAAVLVGLNMLCGCPFNDAKLREIALNLGADVPFCISGGTARAQGIGEILEPLPAMPPCIIALAKAGKKPSTKDMYAALDNEKTSTVVDTQKMIKALKTGDLSGVCHALDNCFEAVWGNIDDVKNTLIESGAIAASLSGSGPTVFGIFENEPKGFEYTASPINCGVEIISE